MKYQTYPAYKDSGVEWLGEVPEHWKIASLSKLFNIKAGGDLKTEFFSEIETENHPYPIYTNANDEKAIYGYTSKSNYSANTITVSGRGEVGFAAYRDHAYDAIIRLLVLSAIGDSHCKFFTYFINAVIDFRVESSAIGQLSTQQISPYKVTFPAFSEQQKIAQFLDHETSKIDTLIEKQQRLIELLKEKRQAVISHAVTKGLNPSLPMKDSGVEWLGEVPEGWKVKRLKFLCNLITEKTTTNNKTVIALENIESWTGKYIKTESEYGGEDVAFVSGDILFGKLRPYLAKVYAASDEGVAFGDLLVYRPNENMVSQYCFYQMLSEGFITTVDSSTYGSKMPRASAEFISEMYFLMPPLSEQKEIVESINSKLKIFEQLAENSKITIELMQERRTALISAAVTGKIDVREWNTPNA